jgi:DNA replication and repair protein RecF
LTVAPFALPVEADAAPLPRLYLSQLRLTAFRNHASADLDLDGRPVVLTGANGAGKTNVLEAISLLSPGRGLRRARLMQMTANDGARAGWAIAARLSVNGETVRLGTGLDGEGEKRLVRVDGAAAGPAALARAMRLVWLTPAMDRLFTDAASGRRRFLDRLVLGLDPDHGRRAGAYEKALRERHRLLKEDRPDRRWLDAVEGRLAEHGVALAAARLDYMRRLQGALAAGEDMMLAAAFPCAEVRLEGAMENLLAEGTAAVDAEDELRRRLHEGRARDAAAGRTLSGPHRSDLVVSHRAKAMPAAACSTGEQKALLIGLVLAHARLLRGLPGGAAPVLLLDEIAAHLDEHRRAALFGAVLDLGAQAWMTGTDDHLFAALGARAQRFHVAQGVIEAWR